MKSIFKVIIPCALLFVAFSSNFATAQVIDPGGEEDKHACVLTATSPGEGTITCKGKGEICSGWKDCALFVEED